MKLTTKAALLLSLIYTSTGICDPVEHYRVEAPAGSIDVDLGFADDSRAQVYVRGFREIKGQREPIDVLLDADALKSLAFEAPGLPGENDVPEREDRKRADGTNGGGIEVRLAPGANILGSLVQLNVRGGEAGTIKGRRCQSRLKTSLVGKMIVNRYVDECRMASWRGSYGREGESFLATPDRQDWSGTVAPTLENVRLSEARPDGWLEPRERLRLGEFDIVNRGSFALEAKRFRVELAPGHALELPGRTLAPGESMHVVLPAELETAQIRPRLQVDSLWIGAAFKPAQRLGFATQMRDETLDLAAGQAEGRIRITLSNFGSLDSAERVLFVRDTRKYGAAQLLLKDAMGAWVSAQDGVNVPVPLLKPGQEEFVFVEVRRDLGAARDYQDLQQLTASLQLEAGVAGDQGHHEYLGVWMRERFFTPSVKGEFRVDGRVECEYMAEPGRFRPIRSIAFDTDPMKATASYTTDTWSTPPTIEYKTWEMDRYLNGLVYDRKLDARQVADFLPELNKGVDPEWRLRQCRVR